MSVNFVNIPTELKQNASFCLWKKEKRAGRVTKVPYNPHNGTMAKTNDASTFSDFATAMKAYAIRDASTSAEDEFKDLDDPEDSEEKSPFRPALSFVTVKLEDMKPHTNPRYQRDEIGIGNAFADYFKPRTSVLSSSTFETPTT